MIIPSFVFMLFIFLWLIFLPLSNAMFTYEEAARFRFDIKGEIQMFSFSLMALFDPILFVLM